jgi:hypothetical protein
MKGRSWTLWGGSDRDWIKHGPSLKKGEDVVVTEILPTDLILSRDLFEKVKAALEFYAERDGQEDWPIEAREALAAIKESEERDG